MMMNLHFMRFVGRILVASVLSMSIYVPGAQADLVSAEQVIASQASRHDRDRILALLEREEVRAQLQAWGVGADAAKARVDALTDAEVAGISGKLDSLPAAGDGIIEGLIFVFIVLLITDILGFTKVFPFTKPVRR
ncbi:MAG: PA2779 family protein [Nitrosomonadales bacterium]|nr:PA2779 family protein [Nitrosomonadales bacterium]